MNSHSTFSSEHLFVNYSTGRNWNHPQLLMRWCTSTPLTRFLSEPGGGQRLRRTLCQCGRWRSRRRVSLQYFQCRLFFTCFGNAGNGGTVLFRHSVHLGNSPRILLFKGGLPPLFAVDCPCKMYHCSGIGENFSDGDQFGIA